jgi:hypothetical protein
VLLALVFLGETLTLLQGLGVLLAGAAVLLLSYKRKKPNTTSPSASAGDPRALVASPAGSATASASASVSSSPTPEDNDNEGEAEAGTGGLGLAAAAVATAIDDRPITVGGDFGLSYGHGVSVKAQLPAEDAEAA